ncbi:TRAP transporter small permease [uncultured Desulfosarcina sp.]|uniref:TRAP transporter small permease n=1 Tax=uncultured Desulfosarcina sp. TaxID=218289 RepID=UPI0029C85175|nr:TRAP transporter small permease [uncultured Desulfosarcina sp.]
MFFNSVFNIMDRCINWFLALLMAGMVVIISAQVWYRFILNDPLSWSEEAGRYLFVWISFMGAAAGVRYQVHLGIDLMDKLLSPGVYRWVVVLVNLIIQIFLLMIIYWGFKILGIIQFQESPSMHISMRYPYMAVPVGGIFMLINSLRIMVAAIQNRTLDREVRI